MTIEIGRLSADIAELRVVTDRLQKSHDETLLEIKSIGVRMISVAEITTELREYRKQLHERFRHVNEQLSEERIELVDLRKDAEADLAELKRRHEAFLDKLDTRLTKVEAFTIRWEANWKTVVAVLTVLATVVSSLISSYIPSALHKL